MTRQAAGHSGYQARTPVEEQGKQRGGLRAAAREDPTPAPTGPERKVSLLFLFVITSRDPLAQLFLVLCYHNKQNVSYEESLPSDRTYSVTTWSLHIAIVVTNRSHTQQ